VISSSYERRSPIVSSNRAFSAWTEIFGDPVAVAAMVARLVHRAEVIVLKGQSYRLRGKREWVPWAPRSTEGVRVSTGAICSAFGRR
jgi:DNA replication protein DnaC